MHAGMAAQCCAFYWQPVNAGMALLTTENPTTTAGEARRQTLHGKRMDCSAIDLHTRILRMEV